MQVSDLKWLVQHRGFREMFMIYLIEAGGSTSVVSGQPTDFLDHYGTISLVDMKQSVTGVKQ